MTFDQAQQLIQLLKDIDGGLHAVAGTVVVILMIQWARMIFGK